MENMSIAKNVKQNKMKVGNSIWILI